jgi:hypothetical protein
MDYIKDHTYEDKKKFMECSSYIIDFVDMTDDGLMDDYFNLIKVLIPIRNKIYKSMQDGES